MNMKMKTLMLTMTAAALMTASVAKADSNPANDSASFTVRITPNVDLGVTVDTTGAAWVGSANLDVAQDLLTDKVMSAPVSIAMAGNFNNQELTLTGANLNTWTLDADETPNLDALRLYALFAKNTSASTPVVADFDGVNNLITTTPTRAGQPQPDEAGDSNHTYELPIAHAEYIGGQGGDVDGMSSTAARKLWLRSSTPNLTSTDEQAAFTVTVTAVSGAGL
jgi:hypothetical protein